MRPKHLLPLLLVFACGEGSGLLNPVDMAAISPDGGADTGVDAEVSDAGPDAKKSDAGKRDGGTPDSGTPETGAQDAAPLDGSSFCGPVSFASQVQPIFDSASCFSCHPNGGNLDLRSGQSHANLVNIAAAACGRVRVVPGNVANSYLMSKLTGVGMCSGVAMGALTNQEIDLIGGWICEGAPNN